ncbi:MAG: choice-of-anchor J domain-containing protein, partial [Thermoplasmatales archaeon]|nr:choice-of-anchor J domain-containing protein [Thermoplasmatales archaeon]
GMLSFWGRSLNDAYGLEEIEYGISTTDTDPSSFTIVSGPVIEVPIVWTEYTYNLTDYIGEDIYIGIHVVSYDHFAFFLDDFSVTGVSWTPPDPDLFCEGDLHFGNVSAGATLMGDFTVINAGGGLLDWEITHEPSWGTWTFNPEQGDDLEPGPGVTVQVTVVAPKQKDDYTGTIKIENKEDPDDFCTIDVSMITPKNKPLNMNMLFLIFLEQHPHLFPILRLMLGL